MSSCLFSPYSHSLAFIPKLKLDTEGFVMGLQLQEDEETNKAADREREREEKASCLPGVAAQL